MKIAFALYGQPRNYHKGHENIMNFLRDQHHLEQNVEVDFFYHCWTLNPNEKFACSPWRNIDTKSLIYKEDTEERIKTLYNPVAYLYENQSHASIDETIYKDTLAYNETTHQTHPTHTTNQINNILFQTYSKSKVRNILNEYVQKTNVKYDFVIITRFDMDILPKINIHNLDLSKTYISDCHLPRNIIADQFIIIPLTVFLKWFDIYDNLNYIFNNRNLYKLVMQHSEVFCINSEEIMLASYLLHFNNTNNIGFFSGRCVMLK